MDINELRIQIEAMLQEATKDANICQYDNEQDAYRAGKRDALEEVFELFKSE
jgi:hypothetical protein